MVTDPAKSRQALTPGTFGWGGAWGTVFWIDPTEQLITIMMVQVSRYSHLNIRQDVANMAQQAIIESLHSGKQGIRGYEQIRR